MRKFMLTTAILLPLSMGSAFAQDAAEPATGEPSDMAQTPATDMPADPASDPTAAPEAGSAMEGGEAADAAAAEAAAEEAAKAAATAELAASGKIVQEQAMNELRLDWVTGATVVTSDATPIGDINDIIVDSGTGQMIAAVIGVGGFLGIGEKQIAVPWDQLTLNYDAQEITSDLTQEEADAAPEYVFREREAAPSTMPATDAAPAEMPAETAAPTEMPAEMPAETSEMPADGGDMPAEGEAPETTN